MPIPLRSVRVPEEVWERALAIAKARGTGVSRYIVECLERWDYPTTYDPRKIPTTPDPGAPEEPPD
jgi:hypothetical protein